ncbi:hypothetical protein WA158_001361 [Blastocystis sp. Blastoise]
MAEIHKMSIQGIRSFGPSEEKVIKFYKPLTIIVGPNGCGKTTIIECLKAACTGTLPKNSNSGQGFINDPKLSDRSETKAQIKLQFTGIDGKTYTSVRKYSLKQQKQKLQFSTLDHTLKTTDDKGNEISLSNRVIDYNATIPELIGISKSILDNVIFCHQEDSYWPLLDGAELKSYFDNIFESTKYIKALDLLKKEKKERNSIRILLEKEEATLRIHLDNSIQKKEDIQNKILIKTTKEKEIESIQSKIDVYSQGKKKKEDIYNQYIQQKRDIENIQKDINFNQQMYNEIRNSITEWISLSKEEITAKIDESDQSSKNIHIEYTNQQTTYDKLQSLLKEQQTKNTKYTTFISQQEGRLITINMNNKTTFLSISSYVKLYLPIESKEFQQYSDISNQIQQPNIDLTIIPMNIQLLQNIYTYISQLYDKDNRDYLSIQESLQSLNKKKNDIYLTIETKKNSILNRKKQLEGQQQSINSKIETLQKGMCDYNTTSDPQTLLTNQYNIIQEEMNMHIKSYVPPSLTYKSSLTSQLDIYKQKSIALRIQKESKNNRGNMNPEDMLFWGYKERSIVIHSLEEDWHHYNDNTVSDNDIHMYINKKKDYINEKLKETENQFQQYIKLQTQITESKTKLAVYTRELKRINDEIIETVQLVEQSNFDIPFSVNSSQIIENYQVLQKLFKDNRGNMDTYNPILYNQIINNINQFISQFTMCSYIGYISKVKYLYEQLQYIYNEQNQEKILLDSLMISLSSLTVNDNTYKQYTKQLNDTLSVISKLNYIQLQIEDYCTKFSLPVKNNIDANSREYTQDRTDLNSDESIDASIKEVSEMISSLESKLADMNQKEVLYQKTLIQYKDKMMSLQQQINELNLKNQKANQERNQLESLKTQLKDIQSELAAFGETEKNMETEIQLQQEEYSSINTNITDMNKTLNSLDTTRHQKDKDRGVIQNAIRVIEVSNVIQISKERETIITGKIELEQTIEKNKNQIEELNKSMAVLSQQLTERDAHVTNLRNIYKCLEYQDSIATLEKRLTLLRVLQEVDIDQIQRDIDIYTRQSEELNNSCYKMKGEIQIIKQNIQTLQAELETSTYKDIQARHRKSEVSLHVYRNSISDVDIYIKAIENSLAEYHRSKIEEINRRLRELWLSTYQGNDIENIELHSDIVMKASRRIYEYGIYMTKNGIRLPMRARCSAGQRSLACILIRLALAETFCGSSGGLMTLDEPTTNLDYENKIALVTSLNELLRYRQKQSNFQLIIITHDEEFGQLLTQGHVGDSQCYWRVSRQANEKDHGQYCSTITKQSWSG